MLANNIEITWQIDNMQTMGTLKVAIFSGTPEHCRKTVKELRAMETYEKQKIVTNTILSVQQQR